MRFQMKVRERKHCLARNTVPYAHDRGKFNGLRALPHDHHQVSLLWTIALGFVSKFNYGRLASSASQALCSGADEVKKFAFATDILTNA